MEIKVLDGKRLYCPRMGYTFPAFDQSLQRAAFCHVGDMIYGRPATVFIDSSGQQWFEESLLAPALVDHFTARVDVFWGIVARRCDDYGRIQRSIMTVTGRLDSPAHDDMISNLRVLGRAYVCALQYVHSANLIVEEAYARFEQAVARYLSPRAANRYIAALLRCPAAARAAELGFSEDTRGTKRIEDVRSSPVAIFADTILFTPHPFDGELLGGALKAGDDLPSIWALRQIVPLVVQLAEEFRYADYSIRTHLRYLLSHIARVIGPSVNVYDMSVVQLLEIMAGGVAGERFADVPGRIPQDCR